MASRGLKSTALFICDIQERFRGAIHEYPALIKTANKMLKASKILNMPVYATTQNSRALGKTVSELDLSHAKVPSLDKTLFSMCLRDITTQLPVPTNVAIVGIESHVCVLQTTLDLLKAGHHVYVISDGVSSCNKEEIPIALARMRQAGAFVTTSESFLFEVMGDASIPEFKQISGLVKETKEDTKTSLQALCPVQSKI